MKVRRIGLEHPASPTDLLDAFMKHTDQGRLLGLHHDASGAVELAVYAAAPDDTLVKFARYYAAVKHAGQGYKGGLNYTHHLADVEAIAHEFPDPDIDPHQFIAACWLHDVKEDCGVKHKELAELFGDAVANLVEAVTDEVGETRSARKGLTLPKTRRAGRAAVRLKLCDRVANARAGGSMRLKYQQEQEDFRRALYTEGENEDLWRALEAVLAEPVAL